MFKTFGTQNATVIHRPHGEYGFQHAGRTHRVAEMTLEPVDRHLRQTSACYGDRFHLIVIGGGSAMRIYEGQLSGIKTGQHRLPHR